MTPTVVTRPWGDKCAVLYLCDGTVLQGVLRGVFRYRLYFLFLSFVSRLFPCGRAKHVISALAVIGAPERKG